MKLSVISISCLASCVVSAPAARKRQIVGLPVGPEIDNSNIPYAAVGPVGSKGDIYGSRGLLGNAGDGQPAKYGEQPNTDKPTEELAGDYTLVPGQKEDADLGLFLDFTSKFIVDQSPLSFRTHGRT